MLKYQVQTSNKLRNNGVVSTHLRGTDPGVTQLQYTLIIWPVEARRPKQTFWIFHSLWYCTTYQR